MVTIKRTPEQSASANRYHEQSKLEKKGYKNVTSEQAKQHIIQQQQAAVEQKKQNIKSSREAALYGTKVDNRKKWVASSVKNDRLTKTDYKTSKSTKQNQVIRKPMYSYDERTRTLKSDSGKVYSGVKDSKWRPTPGGYKAPPRLRTQSNLVKDSTNINVNLGASGIDKVSTNLELKRSVIKTPTDTNIQLPTNVNNEQLSNVDKLINKFNVDSNLLQLQKQTEEQKVQTSVLKDNKYYKDFKESEKDYVKVVEKHNKNIVDFQAHQEKINKFNNKAYPTTSIGLQKYNQEMIQLNVQGAMIQGRLEESQKQVDSTKNVYNTKKTSYENILGVSKNQQPLTQGLGTMIPGTTNIANKVIYSALDVPTQENINYKSKPKILKLEEKYIQLAKENKQQADKEYNLLKQDPKFKSLKIDEIKSRPNVQKVYRDEGVQAGDAKVKSIYNRSLSKVISEQKKAANTDLVTVRVTPKEDGEVIAYAKDTILSKNKFLNKLKTLSPEGKSITDFKNLISGSKEQNEPIKGIKGVFSATSSKAVLTEITSKSPKYITTYDLQRQTPEEYIDTIEHLPSYKPEYIDSAMREKHPILKAYAEKKEKQLSLTKKDLNILNPQAQLNIAKNIGQRGLDLYTGLSKFSEEQSSTAKQLGDTGEISTGMSTAYQLVTPKNVVDLALLEGSGAAVGVAGKGAVKALGKYKTSLNLQKASRLGKVAEKGADDVIKGLEKGYASESVALGSKGADDLIKATSATENVIFNTIKPTDTKKASKWIMKDKAINANIKLVSGAEKGAKLLGDIEKVGMGQGIISGRGIADYTRQATLSSKLSNKEKDVLKKNYKIIEQGTKLAERAGEEKANQSGMIQKFVYNVPGARELQKTSKTYIRERLKTYYEGLGYSGEELNSMIDITMKRITAASMGELSSGVFSETYSEVKGGALLERIAAKRAGRLLKPIETGLGIAAVGVREGIAEYDTSSRMRGFDTNAKGYALSGALGGVISGTTGAAIQKGTNLRAGVGITKSSPWQEKLLKIIKTKEGKVGTGLQAATKGAVYVLDPLELPGDVLGGAYTALTKKPSLYSKTMQATTSQTKQANLKTNKVNLNKFKLKNKDIFKTEKVVPAKFNMINDAPVKFKSIKKPKSKIIDRNDANVQIYKTKKTPIKSKVQTLIKSNKYVPTEVKSKKTSFMTNMPTTVQTNMPTNINTNINTNIPTNINTNVPMNTNINVPTTVPANIPTNFFANVPTDSDSDSLIRNNVPVNPGFGGPGALPGAGRGWNFGSKVYGKNVANKIQNLNIKNKNLFKSSKSKKNKFI